MLFNSRRSKIADEDYQEARSLDPHPNTFDRAAYRRLRDAGLSHEQIKDAVTRNKGRALPIEDLATAYEDNNNDLESAIKDASSYANRYGSLIDINSRMLQQGNPLSALSNDSFNSLPDNVRLAAIALFSHHLSARDRQPDDDHPLADKYTAKPRNHEWMMHLCTMIDPSLKSSIAIENPHGNTFRLNPIAYQNMVGTIQDHLDKEFLNHSVPLAKNSGSVDFNGVVGTLRKQRALDILSSGQFGSPDYKEESYDPE
jgi:hypothetical protein